MRCGAGKTRCSRYPTHGLYVPKADSECREVTLGAVCAGRRAGWCCAGSNRDDSFDAFLLSWWMYVQPGLATQLTRVSAAHHDRIVAPSITGQLVVTLTVRDLRRSADWYGALLAAREHVYVDQGGRLAQVTLTESSSGLQLCLVSHPAGSGELFSEARPGLDHLERLDRLGIQHSGVKEPSYTSNAMLTFRDPDNIQLEFFWSSGTS
jgi:glyoxylase I family protein